MGGKVGWNACLLVRDVVDCVVSGEGIPVHLKMKTEILLFQGERVRKFSCQCWGFRALIFERKIEKS